MTLTISAEAADAISGVHPDQGIVSVGEPSPAVEDRSAFPGSARAGVWPADEGEMKREIAEIHDADASRLYRYALTLTHHHENAEDAVQETFLRYYIARGEGRRFRNPGAWLCRVLRNHVLDGLRMARTQQEVGIAGARQLPDGSQDPEGDCRRDEMAHRVSTSLAPREMECVRLRAEGLRYEEIAEALAVQSGTVGAMLTRAHRKIRQSLRRAGYLADNANESWRASRAEEKPAASKQAAE
jgi:RNA polymerase sigma-70 factor (ECF subfamily)